MAFQKAEKRKSKLRLALVGPSGSGKTFSALRIAKGIGGKIAVVDSERGSASKYADLFEFDVLELEAFAPASYVAAILEAEKAGYDILIIDSLSHAWFGKGGALEMVDQAKMRSKSKDGFGAWREVTPEHNALVDAIVRSRCHVIATMRTKTEWVIEKDENGKNHPRKVGLQPIQREGLEFEFDVVGDLDESVFCVTKSRIPKFSKAVLKEPGEQVGIDLAAWLNSGAEPKPPPPQPIMVNGAAKVSTQPPELRAKILATWKRAQANHFTLEQFTRLAQQATGHARESSDWTENDASLVQVALENELHSQAPQAAQ